MMIMDYYIRWKTAENAVLVAISIPIFSTQLEKSREGVDLANIRSCYAEATLAVLNGTASSTEKSSVTGGTITATLDDDGNYVKTVKIEGFLPQQMTAGWVIDVSNVAGITSLGTDCKISKGDGSAIALEFTYDANGKCTKIAPAA